MEAHISNEFRAMADRAIAAGILETAEKMVNKYLESSGEQETGNWNYGNVIHHAHLILGRIVLSPKCAPTQK